ncbi:unnamed protein product [Urochloa humidicola]
MGQGSSSSSPSSPTGEHSTSTIAAETVTGSHVLRIHGYSRTKGHGVGNGIRSGMFSIGGHSWYIIYYPDGFDAKNADYIRFSVVLDHPIPQNGVKAQMKFSLLDQAGEPVPQFTQTGTMLLFTSTKPDWAFLRYIKRYDLESSPYLKHDKFSIRCDLTIVKHIRPVTTTVDSLTVPPSNLHQHLGDLLANQVGVDVTFQVGDEQFRAHRNVLATRSVVFMAELFGPMKEGVTTPVHIDDMEARVFKTMIHFIYTDRLPRMEEGDKILMAQHLLVAADRFCLDRLKLICEEILRGSITIDIAATTLVLAEQHGCEGLKKACFKFIKSPGNLKAVMATDGFQHLKNSCPSLIQELLDVVAS